MSLKSYFGLMLIACNMLACNSTTFTEEKINPQQLSEWTTLGKGKTSIKNEEFVFEEINDSDGFFVVSPINYEGDIILKYKIKAMSDSSVLITLFSASDSQNDTTLTFPAKNAKPEDIWKWRSAMNHYNLTFNNKSHGYTPFFYKNITSLERGFHIRKEDNITAPYQWVSVEIGRVKDRVWFSLNGDIVFEQTDTDPLKGGHVLFRISGTNSDTDTILAKAAIKDLVISHK
ncbi:hypothetical protein [Aquimarina sp. AD10]|uniref:hypothetical protein n=1 Tax=Aquimarina sp. AD10 TaxID=1714849 RepID=UPI0011C3EFB2|nr:hypothetical protein [Aquimarina sp. AD10]